MYFIKNINQVFKLILLFGILFIFAIYLSFDRGYNMSEKFYPLIDGSMVIKLRAAKSHLLFEDNSKASILQIKEYLNEAKWYANAMLNGGKNDEGTFIPIEDKSIRSKINLILQYLDVFEQTIIEYSKIANIIEKEKSKRQYHKLYNLILDNADEVEEQLHLVINKDLQQFKNLETILLTSSVIFLIIILYIIYTNDKKQVFYTNTIKKQKDDLELINSSLEDTIEREVNKNIQQSKVLFQQARHAQMGEMISMIAHQWRQPLQAISASAINLNLQREIGELDDKEIHDTSKFIQKSTHHMSQTINEFMNFFKTNSENELFNITDVISEIQDMIDEQLKSHGIRLEIILDGCSDINGNKNELIHVLLNLLTNARDALNNTSQELKKITIHAHESDGIHYINVIDNGGGVDVNVIDKIFNPYFTTKEQGKGTGIGLHMVKEIIEKDFNGGVSVKNIDDGVEFTLAIRKRKN